MVAEAGGAAGGVLSTIDPTEIPLFEGDLAGVEVAAAKFRKAGSRCRSAGVGVDTGFQGLAGCYRAPERWELLASTARVRTGAVSFGGDLRAVGAALADYAAEMRPVAAALSRLFDRAVAFTVEVSGDGAWQRDKDLVEANNSLIAQVSAQAEAKAAVERRCANRIEALVGGRVWHAADRPGDPDFAYGAADIPDNAATPWGTPAQWEAPWRRGVLGVVFRYQRGVTVDGLGGAITGVAVLSGVPSSYAWVGSKLGLVDPSTVTTQQAATTQAWRGLALAAAAANPATRPFLHAVSPRLGHEADTTLREMAKGMVAWDMWKTDRARAAGAAVFNLGGILLPGGEASTLLKAARGIRAGSETGLLSRLLSHTDTPSIPDHVPDLPDTAAPGTRAGQQLPSTTDDLARSIGHDTRPHLPALHDPAVPKVREQDTRIAKESNDTPSRTGLPDEIREPDKDSVGSGRRETPVDGPEGRDGHDFDSPTPRDDLREHRGGRSRVHETEWPLVARADEMYRSPAMDELRAAYVADRPTVVELGGRTVQYEPNLPASGMTFGEAFLLGPRAFSSESELAKTVLHENYRLVTTRKADGVDAGLARTETEAAAEFAERTYKVLLEGR